MRTSSRRVIFAVVAVCFSLGISSPRQQSAGDSGIIYGIIADASGAIVPDSTVSTENLASGYDSTSHT
jgi:hypothetical protein